MNLDNLDTNKVVRYFAYAVIIFVLGIIQGTGNLIPPIFGCVPLLTASAAVSVALLEQEVPSMFFGLEAGLIFDICGGNAIGAGTVILTVIACFVSAFAGRRMRIRIGSAVAISAVALALILGALWFVRVYAPGYSYPEVFMINKYIPTYFYTILTVPFIYILMLGLHKGLGNRE